MSPGSPPNPPDSLADASASSRQPTSPAGWNVTAHLSLATTEVRLTSWPGAPDDRPRLIHPTIHEALGLCTALTIATAALDLSNQLVHY
ncbi:esterase [Streptomyces sp. NBC_01341]|uniref:esterase n=1 Tax=Streptomyces sp. NBC_01341 TaxID=2903831 RepID=UPI002E0FA655|nr:esterase [Streptomyces sp. NBC_01341]